MNQPRLRPQHIADLFKPGAKGIVEQVGVALGGLNLCVAEELANHRQRHAAGNEQRRKGVAQIVDADGWQFCIRPDIFPEPLDVLKGVVTLERRPTRLNRWVPKSVLF